MRDSDDMVPSNPLTKARAHVRELGRELARFDENVQSALRKIPGSRMPPPKGNAPRPNAPQKAKREFFGRKATEGKDDGKGRREIPKEISKLPKKGPPKREKNGEKKAPPKKSQTTKTVPSPLPKPAVAPSVSKRPAIPDDTAVRDFIRRSYKTSEELASLPTEIPVFAPPVFVPPEVVQRVSNNSACMPIKQAQVVTVNALSDSDKNLLSHARAAMARIDLSSPRNVAVGAVGLLVTHLLVKAIRKGGKNTKEDETLELDIDSAFGTPTRSLNGDKGVVAGNANAKAGVPPSATRSVKQLFFGGEKESKNGLPVLKERATNAVPKKQPSSKSDRFGTGSEAIVNVVKAHTTVQKATRRLKKKGNLTVNVLETTFLAKDDDKNRMFKTVVAVDSKSKTNCSGGATALKPFDNILKRDTVTFNSRMGFPLQSSTDGHYGKVLETKLCGEDGATLAKFGMSLKSALRAAPVTKSFPLHDRAGVVVGSTRIAIEWDVTEVNASENDAPVAARALLRKLRKGTE